MKEQGPLSKAPKPASLLPYACVFRDVSYHYLIGRGRVPVLKKVNFFIKNGESVALTGDSGAGKSTLLHLVGLLDVPFSGDVFIEDRDVSTLSDYQRTLLRRRHFGFVFQFHHLLPELSAEENVILPQLLAHTPLHEARIRAHELLKRVALGHRLQHKPSELSGGEQQRVSIARALANYPKVLLADEPTGSLDEKTSQSIVSLIHQVAEENKMALFIVTHNQDIARQQMRTLVLTQGRIQA
ncbi:ABC transporter ATP-binding protein [bacterium NHP-B]|nr:ABC transporter ATP-binding protein [bacterium NHP-B]